ncbi:MAG: copper homeostasis protein CutC [Saprospiraceae bacterium]|nr:copper homeostasis protein CutC [Saprospiraceae bacterium]
MKLPTTENILEIAVQSYQSALTAERGGADRIELCTALQTGGLTPDMGLMQTVADATSLPVHVLVRPRLGNFIYDKYEFATIMQTVKACRELKVHGVVVGCLKKDGTIDPEKMRAIRDVAGSLDLTFHRAIDVCGDIFRALDTLMQLEFDRVLSSGAARSAWEGRHMLKKMVEHTSDSHLSIMPGAGVNANNAPEILAFTGSLEIHASAKKVQALAVQDPIGLTFVNGRAIDTKWESDLVEIQKIKTGLGSPKKNI